MAIENRNCLTVVEYENFDPGKVDPGEVVIVNVLGMHAVYIGTSAGEATRMASYNEWEQYEKKIKEAADRAELTRKNAAVLYEMMERKDTDVKIAATKASQDVEAASAEAKKQLEAIIKKVEAASNEAVERCEESARMAERAMEAINAAVASLQLTVRDSLAALRYIEPLEGKRGDEK